MKAGPLLSVIGAQKSYADHVALCGVSLGVRPGELVALLGPNGAGKTTLIRAICGRHRLDSGHIELLGERVEQHGPSHRAQLGLVPQDLAIYPDLSAQQNLEVFGRLHGVPQKDLSSRVERALVWTQLESRRHDRAERFSGGMQRRLNIACGVLHDPLVLLLDEPTVGVDPQSRERIFEMLTELKQRGTGIVLTTHQLDEAQSRCDRIVIMDEGRTIAEGTLEELIAATVGAGQQLTMRVQSDATAPVVSETQLLMNIAEQLPAIVAEKAATGATITELGLQTPSLQDVFLHLTGRELRE